MYSFFWRFNINFIGLYFKIIYLVYYEKKNYYDAAWLRHRSYSG